MKECKRHSWRVGSKNAKLINGKVVVISINIWCERCRKIIRAKYFSDLEYKNPLRKWTNKKIKKPMKINFLNQGKNK